MPGTAAIAAVVLLSTIASVIPIFLGLVAAKFSSAQKKRFSLYAPALSLGIVLSTFYDLLQETAGLQLGALNPIPQTITLILFLIGLVALQLVETGSSTGRKVPLLVTLAYGWALGIGLHGFGEGIVIGYSFISGEAAFTNINQILSFGLHKVGEGFTLGALLAIPNQTSRTWTWSGLIAGLPVGLGGALGFLTNAGLFSTYAFAIGAGFAAYFIIQFSRLLPKRNRAAYGAVAAGFLFMYFAGLLHQI